MSPIDARSIPAHYCRAPQQIALALCDSPFSQGVKMNSKSFAGLLTIAAVGCLIGCSDGPRKSPDVTDSVRKSLDQSNLRDVKVTQDRDKGVVTLTGQVTSDSAKSQAESIAKSIAGSQVVADEIAVVPPGPGASDAKTINSDLDKGIEQNLDAALVQNRFKKDVKYDVKNGVVTLTGEVNSQSKRAQVEKVAAGVPNVQQVVNELQVKDQKASSTQ
jgi:hyperosmotically inducible periplasmic protein